MFDISTCICLILQLAGSLISFVSKIPRWRIAKKCRSIKLSNYCSKLEKNSCLKVEIMLGSLFETKDKGESGPALVSGPIGKTRFNLRPSESRSYFLLQFSFGDLTVFSRISW